MSDQEQLLAKPANRWTGRAIGETIAVALAEDTLQQSALPTNVVLVAASDSDRVVVLLSQLRRFLETHRLATLVCFNVAGFYRRLSDALRNEDDSAGCQEILNVARESRLHDVGLLDQRFRLIFEASFPAPRSLQAIVSTHEPDAFPAGSSHSELDHDEPENELPNIATAFDVAAAILMVHCEIIPELNAMATRHGVTPSLLKSFGPLGHVIDVQGAIASAVSSRGQLFVSAVAADEVFRNASELYAQSSHTLVKDGDSRPVFEWDKDLVARDQGGFPRLNQGRLRKWLNRTLDRLCDAAGCHFMPPLDSAGFLSTMPRHWGLLADADPGLRAWVDLMGAADATRWCRSLRPLEGPWQVSPIYEVLPILRSLIPDFTALRRFSRRIFQPQPGYQFVRIELTHLDLRCLARQILQHFAGDARLARMLIDLDDPISITADEIRTHARQLSGEVGREFRDRTRSRDDTWWKKVIKRLFAAVPAGFSDTQIRVMLEADLGPQSPTEVDVAVFRQLLLTVHPELETMNEDTTIETIERNTGAPQDELRRVLDRADEFGTNSAAIRNVLAGKTQGPRVWEAIRSQAQTQFAKSVEPTGAGDTRLLLRWPVVATGGIGQPAYCTHARGAEVPLLADEVVKLAAFAVAAAGCEVIAIAADEVLVAAPNGGTLSTEDLAEVVNAAAEKGLGFLAWGCAKLVTQALW